MISMCQRIIIFKGLRTSGSIKEISTNSLSIRKLSSIGVSVGLAQLVEQWTGNPEAGGSSLPSNHLIFGC